MRAPLLDGTDREQALAAVEAIATRLADPPPAWTGDSGERSHGTASDASLCGGRSGVALLYGYLALAQGRDEHVELALRHLDQAITSLGTTQMPFSLFTGFVGVAWASEHLRWLYEGDDDPNEEIDEYVDETLDESPWSGHFDLTQGLVGVGVYALERLPRRKAAGCLHKVVARLVELAEETPQGRTWITRPELLMGKSREAYPAGEYNLGVAHGVPGVISFLGRVCASGVPLPEARGLLDDAVAWLLAQRPRERGSRRYDYSTGPGVEPVRARSAWCYGDPGIAAALLSAARSVGQEAWEREAIDLARGAARLPVEESGVFDAALCHGSAGLAHLFARLYDATGDEELKQSAIGWYRRTLAYRDGETGIAGYLFWLPDRNETTKRWVDDPGLLNGAAGVALSLLSASLPVAPDWDRHLLISIPPRGTN